MGSSGDVECVNAVRREICVIVCGKLHCPWSLTILTLPPHFFIIISKGEMGPLDGMIGRVGGLPTIREGQFLLLVTKEQNNPQWNPMVVNPRQSL